MKKERILAIESSCDESAIAYFDSEIGVLESLVHSQVDLHALYGGVVPDLASTEHLKKLPILVQKIFAKNLKISDIDKVAATSGPGLANCLAIGISAASAIAASGNLPLCGVNHLRGHAFSPFIEEHAADPKNFKQKYLQDFLPHLGLLVSGGNSIIFEVDENRKLKILCDTLDDAAGEALDKGAKLLGMPYPGAPILEKTADGGDIKKYPFPNGKQRKISEDPSFSFSGLKTSLRYFLERRGGIGSDINDICASYQNAVITQLYDRLDYFLKQKKYKTLGLSGGVANNQSLRSKLEKLSAKRKLKFMPAARKYCGDNAAMIAFASWIDPEACSQSVNSSLKLEPARAL